MGKAGDKYGYYMYNWHMVHHLSLVDGYETVKSGVLVCPENEVLHKRTIHMKAFSGNGVSRVRFKIEGEEAEFINGKELEDYYNLYPVMPEDVNWIVKFDGP